MRILVRLSGDLSTKARNTRKRFTTRLVENLSYALESHHEDFEIERRWSRLSVRVDDPAAAETCARVFGVQSVSPVDRYHWKGLDDLVAHAAERFGDSVEGRTFAVRARRGGHDVESIPFTSADIERDLGTALLDRSEGVDLTQPEATVSIEVRSGHADLFTEILPGPGGLPLGVEGKALSLVSGGFDSAVASWLMLKRGLSLDYLFFNLGGLAHEVGVLRVMKVVADRWSYGDRPRLVSIDLRPAVESMRETVTPRYWQVVLKRLMFLAASELTRRSPYAALVTGEAVGQVSSQTLQNLAVISPASELPVLRPLIGFNKEEIVDLSRHIGTFELSAAVGEYCAILPRNPATHAKLRVIGDEERKVDLDLLSQAVETRRTIDLRELDVAAIGATTLEVERVPADATVLDLRERSAFDSWHYPGALFFDYGQALRGYGSFRKDTRYLLYCEVGLKSAHLAELMQRDGFEAHHIRGGVRQLRSSLEPAGGGSGR